MINKIQKYLFGNNQHGFTLIELIATIFVTVAVLQVFILITANIGAASLTRDNLTAANLVQEGLEVARNIRDRDWFLGNSFGASLPTGSWRAQWNSNQLTSLGLNPPLKKDSASGFFSYDSGTDTAFKRTIDITAVSANEIRVVSKVNWDYRGDTKEVSAEAHLFNWY